MSKEIGNFVKCSRCNEFHWTSEKCKPEYFVYHPDYLGDEPKIMRANSHEEAAEKYSDYFNQEGSLLKNTENVKVEKDGIIQFFRISAEISINYSAEAITEEEYEK